MYTPRENIHTSTPCKTTTSTQFKEHVDCRATAGSSTFEYEWTKFTLDKNKEYVNIKMIRS